MIWIVCQLDLWNADGFFQAQSCWDIWHNFNQGWKILLDYSPFHHDSFRYFYQSLLFLLFAATPCHTQQAFLRSHYPVLVSVFCCWNKSNFSGWLWNLPRLPHKWPMPVTWFQVWVLGGRHWKPCKAEVYENAWVWLPHRCWLNATNLRYILSDMKLCNIYELCHVLLTHISIIQCRSWFKALWKWTECTVISI